MDSNSVLISLSVNKVLPTILMCFISAVSPSLMVMEIRTRLRSSSTTRVSTVTAYRPWLKYCLTSSWLMRSNDCGWNTSPRASPISARTGNISSSLMALLPESATAAMAGRSCTLMIRMSPSRSRSMALKKPVWNRARMA